MRHLRHFAAASVLVLALAACGDAGEDDGASGETDAPAVAASASATPAPGATPSETATPTPTPSATATVDEMAPPPPPAVAAAPAAFTQCRVCHAIEPGQNGIGPSLAGVVGRRAGSAAGFSYTADMSALGQTWNDATLDRYLADPAGLVPSTTMAIGPLDQAQRRAIIAYLKTL
jgi:cytochrome c